jgi:MFS family permease
MNMGNALVYIPVIPELVNTIEYLYPDFPEEIVGDITSTLFNNAFSFGYIIGPSIGGTLVTYYGFINISFYISLAIVGYAFIYLLICVSIKKKDPNYGNKNIIKRIPYLDGKISRSFSLRRPSMYKSFSKVNKSQMGLNEEAL